MAFWQANQLIRWESDGRLERILWVDPSGVGAYVIDIAFEAALPKFCKVESLELARTNGQLLPENNDPLIKLLPESSLSRSQRELRDRAWNVVLSLLKSQPEIFSEEKRGQLIQDAAESHSITKQTIYRWLRRYWQRGMSKDALIPDYSNSGAPGVDKPVTGKKRGRPRIYSREPGMNIDKETRAQFKSIITLEYAKNSRLDLPATYNALLGRYYSVSEVSESTGRQTVVNLNERPSMAQFRYWYERDNDVFKIDRTRRTPRVYDKDMRAILNTSTGEVIGPKSRYQIDATIADLYLVSRYDRNKIVGRPVLYVLTDVFSRMIVGIYAGFEGPSWVGAMMALINTTADKVQFCKQYGIDIHPEQWPCHDLPNILLSDRGETAGKGIETLIEKFGVHLETAPPYRADWKGIVEQQFRMIQAKYRAYVPGYIQSDYQQRGGTDYRLDATLNIDEFTRIVIFCALHHNTAHLTKGYPFDRDMAPDGVKAIPVELWEWGIQRRNGRSLQYPHELIKLSLLPTDTATITEFGVEFYGCYYSCHEAISRQWFERARQRGVWKIQISYDPRCMDTIYLHDQGKFIECDLTKRSNGLRSMSLWEIDQIDYLNRVTDANHAPTETMSRINLTDDIEHVVSNAVAEKAQQPPSRMSKRARTSNIRKNRAEEKEDLRRRDAFTHAAQMPTGQAAHSKEDRVPEADDDGYSLPEVTQNILEFKRETRNERN